MSTFRRFRRKGRRVEREIGCHEELPLLPHPQEEGMAFRTFHLDLPGREASQPSRRFRLVLPTALRGSPADSYRVEWVDVPVARWEAAGRKTTGIVLQGQGIGDLAEALQGIPALR